MPEYNELWASFLLLLWWLANYFFATDNPEPLYILDIWMDSTDSEQAELAKRTGKPLPLATDPDNPTLRAIHGMVHIASPDCTAKRGPRSKPQKIYPPVDGHVEDAQLELRNVHFNPRNIILDLGGLWLQVQTLTHTIVQVYTREQWDNSICKVSKKERGFKVGMALDFGDWVIAFLTHDLMFTPYWAPTRDQLPAQHPSVLDDFEGFLEEIVEWADERSSKPRLGLAFDAVRAASTRWAGVGVYTANELFKRAGIPIFACEREVFDCPSRFARLCEAYWEHAYIADQKMATFIRPFLGNGSIIAASPKDRLKFMDWLYVFKKKECFVSERLKIDVVNFNKYVSHITESPDMVWLRNAQHSPADPFEPTLIQAALSTKAKNLSNLIWNRGPPTLQVNTWNNNPLERYFKRRGLFGSGTYLHDMPHYAPLFLSNTEMKKRRTEVFYYKSQKEMWSVLHAYPANKCEMPCPVPSSLNGSVEVDAKFSMPIKLKRQSYDKREKASFQYIVQNTKKAAVGPTDYCGAARKMRRNGLSNEWIVLLCRKDPMVQPFYANRLEQRLNPKGVSKRSTRKQRSNMRLTQTDDQENDSAPVAVGKKRRLSADQRLALSAPAPALDDDSLPHKRRRPLDITSPVYNS